MELKYNIMLLPIVSAVMLSYNRPVTLDEIADGVITLLNSQRDAPSSQSSTSQESTSDSSYIKIVPTRRKRK